MTEWERQWWKEYFRADAERREKKQEEEKRIRLLAFRAWNYNELPPEPDREQVAKYINEHPELFRGAGPQ